MKRVNEGFIERPSKLQILFRHPTMHGHLKKSFERPPRPVAFKSKITEKRGMKVIDFIFFFALLLLSLLFLFFLFMIKL